MVALTKDEVSLLVTLVEGHSEVTSRATSASDNMDKQAAWKKITTQFNASIRSGPRKPEQLRLKWENLKKSARKRSAIKRRNATDGSPTEIPPDDILDRVACILGATSDSHNSSINDDRILDVEFASTPPEEPAVEVSTPIRRNHFCPPDVSAAKLKRSMIIDYNKSRTERNFAIAEYYTVKKLKVELEIQKLRLEMKKLRDSIVNKS